MPMITGHSYRVEVPDKDPLLERPDVGVQEVEPLGLEADLVHVDIARRHVLVAALQAAVLRNSPISLLVIRISAWRALIIPLLYPKRSTFKTCVPSYTSNEF